MLALAASHLLLPERELRYVTLMNGQKAGSEVDRYGADGTVSCEYEFNDRGRGPKIRAKYTFGEDGLPTKAEITGVSYYKAPVDERFELTDGRSKWDSQFEHGTGGRGFYMSNDGAGQVELANLVRSLKKSPNNSVAILPAGEAKLEKLDATTVKSHGESMEVTEYAISGLGFTPTEIWLDSNDDYFCTPGAWGATFREGWEDTNAALLAIQDKNDALRLQRRAKDLLQHPLLPIAIEHVNVFDSRRAQVNEDQTVVIDGNHIAEVGKSSDIATPKEAMLIDGTGKTLLPGLFDMHVHTGPDDGIFDIASGVTTVRDMGNDIDSLGKTQASWDSGAIVGPRLFKAGLIDGPGKYQAPTGLYAATLDEALAAVKRYHDNGFVQTKLYSSLNPEFVPAIAKRSHELGMRLSGHVPDGITAAKFVEEGADEIQHINFVLLNFLGDKKLDTRTPQRFTEVGRYGCDLDLDSPAVSDFIKLLVSHKTTVDVTLGAFEPMYCARPGKPSPDMLPIWDRLPVLVRRGGLNAGLPADDQLAARYAKTFEICLRMTKKMFQAGVPILVGTDGAPGTGLHRELELDVRAGIPPAMALQDATWLAAKVLKQDGRIGSIEKGKLADLYLVEGDPTKDISDIRRGRKTFKGGAMVDCDAAYASVGISPAK